MSDLVNEGNEEAQPKEIVALQIILNPDGGIKIQGPTLADRTAAYGLLEVAKDMVREMHTVKVVKPSGGLIQHIRNGRH